MTDTPMSSCLWCHGRPVVERSPDGRSRFRCPDRGVYTPWCPDDDAAAESWNRMMGMVMEVWASNHRDDRLASVPEADRRLLSRPSGFAPDDGTVY